MPINDNHKRYLLDETFASQFSNNSLTMQQLDELMRRYIVKDRPTETAAKAAIEVSERTKQQQIDDLRFQVDELEHHLRDQRVEQKRLESRVEDFRKSYVEQKTQRVLLQEKYDLAMQVMSEMTKQEPAEVEDTVEETGKAIDKFNEAIRVASDLSKNSPRYTIGHHGLDYEDSEARISRMKELFQAEITRRPANPNWTMHWPKENGA